MIAVSILVIASLLTILGVLINSTRRLLRWAAPNSRTRSTQTPPAYGALHGPADPVGPIGHPAPTAQLPDNPSSSEDLYGD